MDSDKLQKVYDNYAVFYDVIFGKLSDVGRMAALDRLILKPGDKVLEVGVGTGLSLPRFPSFCRVHGIDMSEEMIRRAHERIDKHGLSNVVIERMDACKMDFPDNSFDAVFAAYLVSVVPDPGKLLSEIKRVCKKGGLITMVNHFRSNNKVISSIETAISPFCSKHLGFRTDLPLTFLLNDSELKLVARKRTSPVSVWEVVEFCNLKERGN
ncbi:MAG TPA: methyltransferase domain-containing protein [Nitrospirota bacterium]|nr:methyltransferase domain-containing protein [Nitrospirota bacterium]